MAATIVIEPIWWRRPARGRTRSRRAQSQNSSPFLPRYAREGVQGPGPDGEEKPIVDLGLKSRLEHAEDPERNEVLVGVEWERDRDTDQAIWEKGMFANQNTVCKLRNRFTIERLVERFGLKE